MMLYERYVVSLSCRQRGVNYRCLSRVGDAIRHSRESCLKKFASNLIQRMFLQ